MESGVEFVACDNPHANRLTIHILAAVAEDVARSISERTKAALAAYKARGGVLGAARPGAPRLSAEARGRGACAGGAATKARAENDYTDLVPVVVALKAEGLSLRQVAVRLNADGNTMRQDRPCNAVKVWRVLGVGAVDKRQAAM
jgi:DNA invertase Pin-like site-specific DNA recombinase